MKYYYKHKKTINKFIISINIIIMVFIAYALPVKAYELDYNVFLIQKEKMKNYIWNEDIFNIYDFYDLDTSNPMQYYFRLKEPYRVNADDIIKDIKLPSLNIFDLKMPEIELMEILNQLPPIIIEKWYHEVTGERFYKFIYYNGVNANNVYPVCAYYYSIVSQNYSNPMWFMRYIQDNEYYNINISRDLHFRYFSINNNSWITYTQKNLNDSGPYIGRMQTNSEYLLSYMSKYQWTSLSDFKSHEWQNEIVFCSKQVFYGISNRDNNITDWYRTDNVPLFEFFTPFDNLAGPDAHLRNIRYHKPETEGFGYFDLHVWNASWHYEENYKHYDYLDDNGEPIYYDTKLHIIKAHDQAYILIDFNFVVFPYDNEYYPDYYLDVNNKNRLFDWFAIKTGDEFGIEVNNLTCAEYDDAIVGYGTFKLYVPKGEQYEFWIKFDALEKNPQYYDEYNYNFNHYMVVHSVNGFIDQNGDGRDDRTKLTEQEIADIKKNFDDSYHGEDKEEIGDITGEEFSSFLDVIKNVKDFYTNLYNIIPRYLHNVIASAFVLLLSVGFIKIALG